jgi:diacylglycerol kinase
MPSFKQSVFFALNGLKVAFEEKHIRVHLIAVLIVSAAGFYFSITQTEWLMCLLLFALVVGLEVMNTAIERFVDMVEPEWNEKAGKIKDLSAGAVLWSSVLAAVCGALIFGKYILALL